MRIITELFNNTKLCWESFAKWLQYLPRCLGQEERDGGDQEEDPDRVSSHYCPASFTAHWLRLHHLLLLRLLQALHHLVDVDGLVVLLDHLPGRQAGPVAGVPGAETDRDLC